MVGERAVNPPRFHVVHGDELTKLLELCGQSHVLSPALHALHLSADASWAGRQSRLVGKEMPDLHVRGQLPCTLAPLNWSISVILALKL